MYVLAFSQDHEMENEITNVCRKLFGSLCRDMFDSVAG